MFGLIKKILLLGVRPALAIDLFYNNNNFFIITIIIKKEENRVTLLQDFHLCFRIHGV